jgi:ABC-type glutathione transport system ATPase component
VENDSPKGMGIMALNETYGRNSEVPAARICGVSKHYNGVLAVNNVSFEVAQGELLTLLGPSGCGKTTTMRSIAGLERRRMATSKSAAGWSTPPLKTFLSHPTSVTLGWCSSLTRSGRT